MDPKTVIRELLTGSGIHLNGPHPYDVQVHDERAYERWLSDAELGLGESYMEGWWDCVALDEFIDRVLRAGLDEKVKRNFSTAFYVLSTRLFNQQTRVKSKRVGREHYDLGNDLFSHMLDKSMVYSCGYWQKAKNIDQAQEAKLDLICKKLNLKPGMKVLDIGCGWGSFAKYAAEKYDVEVLGVSISKKQIELGNELCKGLPVTLLFKDYRDVEGKFDAVVSVGFFEHVGYKNYDTYMKIVDRCLTDDGIPYCTQLAIIQPLIM